MNEETPSPIVDSAARVAEVRSNLRGTLLRLSDLYTDAHFLAEAQHLDPNISTEIKEAADHLKFAVALITPPEKP